MLTYNSQLKSLILPEYGRTIQQMVDHCLTIEDRAERTACAKAIVKAMLTLQPRLREQHDYEQKLWDHLAIMSDFRLDIDWPLTPAGPEEQAERPERLPYCQGLREYRNYGVLIPRMLRRAVEMEGGPEKDTLLILIANQMKKMLAQSNPNVEDRRIFADIACITSGAITFDPAMVKLCDYKFAPAPGKKRKKK